MGINRNFGNRPQEISRSKNTRKEINSLIISTVGAGSGLCAATQDDQGGNLINSLDCDLWCRSAVHNAHTHVHTRVHVHTNAHACVDTCAHTHARTHTHTHGHARAYTQITNTGCYLYTSIKINRWKRTTHTHTHTHTYSNVH